MAGSASFGRKSASGAAAYKPLPKLPQPPGIDGFARLPCLDDQPAPANDVAPHDWREGPLPAIPAASGQEDCFVDEIDIETWKARRKGRKSMPWRQISLMAALSFGIGSFVLPDDLNAMVRPVLWALSAMAFASSFAPRRKV